MQLTTHAGNVAQRERNAGAQETRQESARERKSQNCRLCTQECRSRVRPVSSTAYRECQGSHGHCRRTAWIARRRNNANTDAEHGCKLHCAATDVKRGEEKQRKLQNVAEVDFILPNHLCWHQVARHNAQCCIWLIKLLRMPCCLHNTRPRLGCVAADSHRPGSFVFSAHDLALTFVFSCS
jgi:hypothetical protein